MPGPDETAPATSPDKVGNVYGIDEQQEREMKGGSADELRSTWYDIVDVIVGNGGTPAPYVSPTGDTQFEARVNALINQRLVDINAAAGAGVADAYSHKRADTASPKPKQNVAKAADPVSLFNGELTYAATDFQLNGAGFDFAFVRSY